MTTKKYTPFDASRKIIIPGPPIHPVQPERGSWSASYTFRQYIVERGKEDGWGFFGQLAFANKSTSPISKFVNVGIGGNGLFKHRRKDEFGVAYAYTDLSDVLKDNLDPLSLRRLLPEHQGEIFYNFHITPWLRFTADLQVIRPTRPVADIAIIPGVRLEVILRVEANFPELWQECHRPGVRERHPSTLHAGNRPRVGNFDSVVRITRIASSETQEPASDRL